MSLAFRRRVVAPATFCGLVMALGLWSPRDVQAAPGTTSGQDAPSVATPSTGVASPSTAAAAADMGPIAGEVRLPVNASGSYTYVFPFDLPQARGLTHPSLALTYSSSAEWGIAGRGFSLGVPFIARVIRSPNKYVSRGRRVSDKDRFITQGGEELVPICQVVGAACSNALPDEQMPAWAERWLYFRPRIDRTFDRYFLSPNKRTWRVQLKGSAVDYELGDALDASGSALEANPNADANEILPAKWLITRAYDGTAEARASAIPKPLNQTSFRYDRGPAKVPGGPNGENRTGPLYLTDIFATSPRGPRANAADVEEAAQHVHLDYEPRADKAPFKVLGFGFPNGEYDRRLKRVDVTVKPFGLKTSDPRELLRRYHLTYLKGKTTSFLEKIELEGRCDAKKVERDSRLPEVTDCPKLPPTVFGYDELPTRWIGDSVPAGKLDGFDVVRLGIDDRFVRWVDVNHDNLVDIVAASPNALGGRHAVWLNGLDGNAGSFKAVPIGIRPVGSDTAASISSGATPHVFGDFDGDGDLEMLLANADGKARIYELENDGGAWTWVGRALPRLLPPMLLGNPNLRVVDVDRDGASDLLVAENGEMRTYFSLAHAPGGEGRFGSFDASKPDELSDVPVTFPSPRLASGEPLAFERTDVRLGDLNGDHIPDLIHIAPNGVTCWAGGGSGAFGVLTARSPDFPESTAFLAFASPLVSDNETSLRVADVSGDGFDDLVVARSGEAKVLRNDAGAGWDLPLALTVPRFDSRAPRFDPRAHLVLADVYGRGHNSLVWNVPGSVSVSSSVAKGELLRRIANGYGGTTDIVYVHMTEHELSRRLRGAVPAKKLAAQWLTSAVSTSDNLDLVGGTKITATNLFSYDSPYVSPLDQRFLGFREVTSTSIGDATHPTAMTRVRYHLGECVDDRDTPVDECSPQMARVGHPRAALTMRPSIVQRFDESGTVLETVHYAYRVRHLYRAMTPEDGHTYQAFAERTNVDRYPTPNRGTPSTTTVNDVRIDRIGLNFEVMETTSMPVGEGFTRLTTEAVVDGFGNTTSTTRVGRDGIDEPMRYVTKWALPPGDATGWTFRPIHRYSSKGRGPMNPTVTRELFTDFDATGRAKVVRATLAGTLPLVRLRENPAQGENPSPPLPPAASKDGQITIAKFFYDEFGNVTGTVTGNDRCTELGFDSLYAQLPTEATHFVGAVGGTGHPVMGTCGGTALKTFTTYDRGFGHMVISNGYNGERGEWVYDGFGRIKSAYKPHPTRLGERADQPYVKYSYYVFPDNVPLSKTLAETLYEAPNGTTAYRKTWTFTDGFMRPLATIDEADPSAGDEGAWIVRGVTKFSRRGNRTHAYLPWFWNGAPAGALLGDLTPRTKASTATYDAFGRPLETFAIDGTRTSRHEYIGGLAYRVSDAEDLASGSVHAGTPTTLRFDGFGRLISESQALHENGAIRATETNYTYDHDSNLTRIERKHPGTNDASVVRTMTYDSLGRLVLNVEPNTNTALLGPEISVARPPGGGTRPAPVRAWRYAYNDDGDLVGTSDARGCGKNLHYDGGGRLLAEDYWPCLLAQGKYTAPDLTTGNGTEAFYRYDMLPAFAGPILGPQRTLGRLVATYDRGGMTVAVTDGRARPVRIERRIARPVAPGATPENLAERYASRPFIKETAYREDDTVAWTSTGAEAADLLASSGASTVSPVYSKRGVIVGLTSSYGALVASTKVSAEGLALETVYGDAASTTTTRGYDERLRLKTVETVRARASGWSASPPVISPPPRPAAGTTQLILESLQYQYDEVGNPIAIKDLRDPAEWAPGAKPATRTFKYDDLYRLTEMKTSYGGVDDVWVSPYAAENAGPIDDAKRDRPAPSGKIEKRTTTQTFAFDWLGNTTSTTDKEGAFYDRALGTITNGTATAGPNRLVAASDGRGGSLNASYDAAGNLISLDVKRASCAPSGTSCTQYYAYDWDEVGRLARARRTDATSGVGGAPGTLAAGADLSYVYDADGDRVLKSSTPPGGAETRHTLYVFSSLEVRRALWVGSINDYDRTAKTEVPRLGSIGRVLFADAGLPITSRGKQHVLLELPGHLGSTSTVLDKDTGELVEKKSHLPFGATESDYRPERWGSFREEIGFTGKEEDIEVGLIYFGARYLAPYLGRWISADPLAIHAAGADLNPYAYVRGRATAATDPNGLQDMPDCSTNPNGCGSSNGSGPVNGNTPDAGLPTDTQTVTAKPPPNDGGAPPGGARPDTTPGTGSGHGQPTPADRGGRDGSGEGGRGQGNSSSDGNTSGYPWKENVFLPIGGIAYGFVQGMSVVGIYRDSLAPNSAGFTAGQSLGQTIASYIHITSGFTTAGGGSLVTATGVGAPPGAAAVAVGVTQMAAGALVAKNAAALAVKANELRGKGQPSAAGSSSSAGSSRTKGPSVPEGKAVKVDRAPDGLEARGRPLTPEQARTAIDNGQDVFAADREVAREIAGKNAIGPETHCVDGEVRFPHYHRDNRVGGHIFFGEGQ